MDLVRWPDGLVVLAANRWPAVLDLENQPGARAALSHQAHGNHLRMRSKR